MCKTSGCSNRSWNGQPDQLCCKQCGDSHGEEHSETCKRRAKQSDEPMCVPCVSSKKCIVPTCKNPACSDGEYYGTCDRAICINPGCINHSWNGMPDQKCSGKCVGWRPLPKPVTSMIIERKSGPNIYSALAEMNGWRKSMEDSHCYYIAEDWSFHAIFDGHSGSACSTWISRRMKEEIEKMDKDNCKPDKQMLTEMVRRLDNEFFKMCPERETLSGSTCAFVFVETLKDGSRYVLVGNVGDSRVLIGKGKKFVECSGTDGALTNDHKPDFPSERERIERTGGYVDSSRGEARVNGNLSVSRAFGDRILKLPGHVSVEPEFFEYWTNPSPDQPEFLMLVCDGISEGLFPNKEVVEFAAKALHEHNGDPGQAAADVCRMALERKSMDNLTCMIVVLNGGECKLPDIEFIPGEFWDHLSNPSFRDAYAAMAKRAKLNLVEAVETRFDDAFHEFLASKSGEIPNDSWVWNGSLVNGDLPPKAKLAILREEIARFGEGPPSSLEPGSRERSRWFDAYTYDALRGALNSRYVEQQ